MHKLDTALQIAREMSVKTPPDSVVLYSISYLPTDENKQQALKFMKQHPESMMLDDTECGKALMQLGLETDNQNHPQEIMQIWAVASRRFILAASGNVTAFVQNADERSTFRRVELPLILQNERIKLINGMDKFVFAKQFAE